MSTPLSQIPHSPKAILAAARNNCWNVYCRAAGSDQVPHPEAKRVINARTKAGVVQVCLLQSGKWQALCSTDTVFQG